MNNKLREEILAYQAIAQQAKSAGSKLANKLVASFGWTILERVANVDDSYYSWDHPVAVSPELVRHKDWELVVFDGHDGCWNIDAILAKSEWDDHVVVLSVIS